MASTNFGPYSANGLSFDFAFHHVVEIEVRPIDPCKNFSTRTIVLRASDGSEVEITCFNDGGHDTPRLIGQGVMP